MAAKDYRKDLCIEEMVYARLPFLLPGDTNATAIGHYALEAMFELNSCFMVEAEEIGNEPAYSVLQRSIISDITSVYLLIAKTTGATAGVSDGVSEGSSEGKILTKSVAGSVEVEWEQLSSSNGGMMSSAKALMDSFKLSARRKAKTLGCDISWDNADILVDREYKAPMAPFIVVACKNKY